MDRSDIVDRILDAAQRLCQTRGFNAFSFRDLAEQVGIRSASIHYHFPTKNDLGQALMMRYRQHFESFRAEINRKESSPGGKLRRYVDALREVVEDQHKLCLCSMLGAERDTLSAPVQDEIRKFVEENEAWLAKTLAERKGTNASTLPEVRAAAAGTFAALQGAMLAARACDDARRFDLAADWLLTTLAV